MRFSNIARHAAVGVVLTATLSQVPGKAQGQFTPIDFGQAVNGFQDDFSGEARDANWVAVGPGGDLYEQANGLLKVTATDGDPNHLLYQALDYSNETQEVLARIRATAFGTGDFPRGGVAVGVDPDSSQGINLHFRDSNQDGVAGRQFKLLDDARAWGPPGLKPDWLDNAWYWLRLRQTSSTSGGSPNIFAKVWPADGSAPEPDNWQMTWTRNGRVGFAGLAANSGGTLGEFEVDYVLIKAEGLPSITVGATAFPTPFYLSITSQPQDATVGLNQTTNLTIQTSSSTPATIQWQRAAPGSTNFGNVAGANGTTFTTPASTATDEGVKYRAVVTLAGATNISREAILHVDAAVPTLVSARTLGRSTNVTVRFSEAVTAPATGAFSIDNGVTISSVTPGSEPGTFELATSALNASTAYSITVNGIRDAFGNEIAANTKSALDLSMEVPFEFGQAVAGFQDDFLAATRDELWIPVPPEKDAYEQTGGLLKVTVVGDNPGLDTHLLYSASGYSDTVQEVLARIRVTNFSPGDPARAGVAVAVNAEDSQGINLHFRDQNQDGVLGRQFKLLDDRRAWGPPGLDLDWLNNTWYWLRLRQTGPEAPNNINAKVWKADGATPEPDDWQLNWGRSGRIGFAGLVGSSIGGISEYDVDYILIKAEGLPTTTVAASSFGFGPFLNITGQPTNAVVPAGQNVTLTAAGSGSAALTFQWQKASPGSSNFVDVPSATSASLTVTSPTEADNGSRYRVVLSVPGLSKTSREATIITDVTAPSLISARTLGNPNKVTVVFSENLASLGAGASFALDNGITVTGSALGLSSNVVELTTSEITPGRDYTLTVSGVNDQFGNVIAPGSTIPIGLFVELPVEFGQNVNGFQDDFTSETRNPDWVANGPGGDLYEQADGVLKVGRTSGDPNHLLYMPASGYNDATHEVLARMRVKTFATGDYPRGGVGVGVDGDSGQGIELHFRNGDFGAEGTRFRLLDDARAWGPAIQVPWATDQWLWLRLRQNGSTTSAGDNILAKVWPADGSVPEPADWQATWARADRTGYIGITGTSTTGAEGTEELEVDYILIKAEGLPSTTPAASAFSLIGPKPTLLQFNSISRTPTGQVSLEWTGNGALEEGNTVSGPWTPVTPASSPHLITVGPGAKFYRLLQR